MPPGFHDAARPGLATSFVVRLRYLNNFHHETFARMMKCPLNSEPFPFRVGVISSV
jgi:hypothetical protein